MRKFVMFGALSLALVALLIAFPAAAGRGDLETIAGVARVIDADVVAIGTQRIILWGIDAPERNQSCTMAGRTWGCWQAAVRELQTLADGRDLTCRIQGAPDRLGRHFGICATEAVEINDAMVRHGMALAFLEQTDAYLAVQERAQEARRGLWQNSVEFIKPWDWRRTRSPGGLR